MQRPQYSSWTLLIIFQLLLINNLLLKSGKKYLHSLSVVEGCVESIQFGLRPDLNLIFYWVGCEVVGELDLQYIMTSVAIEIHFQQRAHNFFD